MYAEVRKWLWNILELVLYVIALLTLLQVLFAADVPKLFGIDMFANIGALMTKLGNAGLIGVIAAAIVAFLIVRARDGAGR
ncbi:MAG: hypothetical protein FJX61_09860 [Alphaproteobacteria bacterium]|nr:hypothetical protein [Alphaproteobacteria bacterium]